jgi:pimeloyl-ACP methyl ester carboxylesterase
MKILYYHGGPGMNSNPETHLLTEPFAEAGFELVCWNEPSDLRPEVRALTEDQAYGRYLEHAEHFFLDHFEGTSLVVMAHSFGAHAACHVIKKHPGKVARVVFVSTDLVPSVADLNVFRFAAKDFEENGDSRCRDLQNIIERYSGRFDGNTEAGFGVLIQNPRWVDYYWINRKSMTEFAAYYAQPGYTLDLDGFLQTRRTFRELDMNLSTVPAIAIYGAQDIVVTRDVEIATLKKRFSTLRLYDFEHSAHYPHIEQTEEFLQILSRELKREFSSSLHMR